jgi:hypothetical protein
MQPLAKDAHRHAFVRDEKAKKYVLFLLTD